MVAASQVFWDSCSFELDHWDYSILAPADALNPRTEQMIVEVKIGAAASFDQTVRRTDPRLQWTSRGDLGDADRERSHVLE